MTWTPPVQRSELIWAAVDFDGTIARSNWSVDNPHAAPGEPIWENIQKLDRLVERGMKIIIHTSRSWADYEAIESWLVYHGVHFDRIVCGKLLARAYVDDRSIQAADPEWLLPHEQSQTEALSGGGEGGSTGE